jgi:hypothetical protein
MRPAFPARWPRVFLSLGVLLAAGGVAGLHIRSTTRNRIAQQHQQAIEVLSERKAAEHVRRLAQDDTQWLAIIVAGLTDQRQPVAAAAKAAILDLVERWERLSPARSSPKVAELASLLARHASQLPADGLGLAQSLSQRLLLWPLDARRADADQLIADCEAVLRLPLPNPPELQLAAVALPANPPVQAPPDVAPSREPTSESKQPVPSRKLRISDD